MIGNDVIDLAAARKESNWRRKGFLDKLFNAEEKQVILSSPDPEEMVWLLWSMKEAAYKIYNRTTGIRSFMPLRLTCSLKQKSNGFTGKVTCNSNLYHTETIITKDLIHTVAVLNKRHLSAIAEASTTDIAKDGCGLPYLAASKGTRKIPVSKSHHGRFEKVVYIAGEN